MGRSFYVMMEYLRNYELIRNQADLAKILKVATPSVSGMKKRDSLSDTHLPRIADALAKLTGEDPKTVLNRLYDEIPEVQHDAAEDQSDFTANDYCRPMEGKFKKFVGTIHTVKVRFTDTIAVHRDLVKLKGGCSNIVYMTYLKTNLIPAINPNDILVVQKINKVQGEGFYICDCKYDISVVRLKLTRSEGLKGQRDFETNNENDLENIIGKVIGIFRTM